MLSFMKDGQSDSNNPNGVNPEDVENTAGLPTAEGQDYLKTAEHGKNLKHSTITLALLFTVGALCLWFMIKKVAPQEAGAVAVPEEAKIEDVLRKLKAAQTEMHDKIDDVGRFYQFSEVEQISVSELKKNPFEQDFGVGSIETVSPSTDVWKKADVEGKADDLDLQSIIKLPQGGCCMINDKILYEGDKIGGFTVTKIDLRYVVLESEGHSITKKMAE